MEITTDLILHTLQDWVENKTPVSPDRWVDACLKIVVLLGDEHDKLFNLQQEVAKMKANYLAQGETASASKIKVEATDLYKEMNKQKAKIDQIEEMIRLSKIMARMKNDEFKFN